MGETSIEWADYTFNPWLGCTKVSPACDHCYAEAWAKRAGDPQLWQGARRRTTVEYWQQPFRWNDKAKAEGVRRRVFCASLADVFDNVIDPQWRSDLFQLISSTEHLDWLLLTKRIGNAPHMMWHAMRDAGIRVLGMIPDYLPNVWLGATVANQEEADRDIPKLLRTPARARFLSCEPLLGPIDLGAFMKPIAMMPPESAPKTWPEWNAQGLWPEWVPERWRRNIEEFWSDKYHRGPREWLRDAVQQRAAPHGALMRDERKGARGERKAIEGRFLHTWNNMCVLVDDHGNAEVTSTPRSGLLDPGPVSGSYQGINWVIVGGESGAKDSRPMHPAWARSLRDQCAAAGVAYLFKQWGDWAYFNWEHEAESVSSFYIDDRKVKARQIGRDIFCRAGKKGAGRELDGRTHDAFPEVS